MSATIDAVARRYPIGDVKTLWALAAGRCCFPGCAEICIVPGQQPDDAAVIGDIAHIVAHSQNGPRATDAFPQSQLDTYANWVLLCPTHHRLVDAQPSTYDADTLHRWKRTHEGWVARQLEVRALTSPATVRAQLDSAEFVLHCVSRAGEDPWRVTSPPAGPPVRRWDDPEARYSVRYAADTAFGAVIEDLARFRRRPGLTEEMAEFLGESPSRLDAELRPGTLPRGFVEDRVLSSARVSGVLVDPRGEPVLGFVNERIAALLGSEPPDHLSMSAEYRRTQAASRIVFSELGCDGIVYRSPIATGYKLYALFETAETLQITSDSLAAESSLVESACRALGIATEPDRPLR